METVNGQSSMQMYVCAHIYICVYTLLCVCVRASVRSLDHQPMLFTTPSIHFVYMRSDWSSTVYNSVFITVNCT